MRISQTKDFIVVYDRYARKRFGHAGKMKSAFVNYFQYKLFANCFFCLKRNHFKTKSSFL